MKNKILLLSQENQKNDSAIKNGVQKEQEITFYAEIGNPEGLAKAVSTEDQIQAEVKIDDKRRMRVRKTTDVNNNITYELTTKILIEAQDGIRSFMENTKEISQEVFEMFVLIVPSYQHKKRYCFQIEKMKIESGDNQKFLDVNEFKYEVDVFFNKDNQPSTWCKIDVEIQDLEKQMSDLGFDVDSFNIKVSASKLPFEPSNFILMDDNTSQEYKDKVSEIYNKQFLIFNTI